MTDRFDPLAPPPTVVDLELETELAEVDDSDDGEVRVEISEEDIAEGRRHVALGMSVQFYEGTSASPEEAVEAARRFTEFLENG